MKNGKLDMIIAYCRNLEKYISLLADELKTVLEKLEEWKQNDEKKI